MGTTPTIHNAAANGQIAKTVLMPGDPLRAKFIAENYLRDAVLFSNIRGIPVYTGVYDGKKLSVMASGMGAGSMGIYSYELYNNYDVQNIIRVGTAGGLSTKLQLRDIVFALSCSTDSGFATQYELPGTYSPCCSFRLLNEAVRIASEMKLAINPGMIFSGEAFHYTDDFLRRWTNAGALAVEMETAALYMNAQMAGKDALAICTVTDLIYSGRHCTTDERERSLNDMLKLALTLGVSGPE